MTNPNRGTRQTFPPSPSSPILFTPNKVQQVDMTLLRIPYWHEALEIKYYLSGAASVSCGGRLYTPRAGDLLVINPCECHWTTAEEAAVYHLMLIDLTHPSLRALAGLCPALFRFDGAMALKNLLPGENSACKKLFLLLCEQCEKSGIYDAFKENLLRAFLCALIDEAHEGELAAKDPGRAVAPALRYIEAHYGDRLSIEILAGVCAMSPSGFSHQFRRTVGVSPVKYLNDYRVSKALALMRVSDLTITQIAAATGFSNPSYFSRVFRAAVGVPPGKYKS